MNFAVVSTCRDDHWRQYGQRMVESFAKYWPAEIKFYLYAEGFDPQNSRVIGRPLPPWLASFKARHLGNAAAHGKRDGGYDYRHDCVRFAHKVAAITDAALTTNADVLIWMDADTLTHADVTPAWLSSLFDRSGYIAWLDRNACYPETGFLMFNCRHAEHLAVIAGLCDLYQSGRVLQMRETHDAFVLQEYIGEWVARGRIAAHSLSGPIARKCSHAFINSRLGECLDHCKGRRKERGRSKRSDLHVQRNEAYWQC